MEINESLREKIASTIGVSVSKRVDAFEDGSLYVSAGWRGFWAWLIDFILVAASSFGCGAAYYAMHRYEPDAAVGFWVISVFALLVLPFVYGWFYSTGRGLGGLVAHTQVVRPKSGARLGFGRAGLMMFGRLVFIFIDLLGLLGGMDGFNPRRVNIDLIETKQLHDAGFNRL